MVFSEFEAYVKGLGHPIETVQVSGASFLIVKDVRIPEGGSHAGEACEVGLFRSMDIPWLPEAKIHVRPHLTPMGQRSTQASPMGSEWQYLSRRFDKPPTPKTFYAHILTVLAEL